MRSDEIYYKMTHLGSTNPRDWESGYTETDTDEDKWLKDNPRILDVAIKKAAKKLGLSLEKPLSAKDYVRLVGESAKFLERAYRNHLEREYKEALAREAVP